MSAGTGSGHARPGTIDTLKWAVVYTGLWALLSENQGWGFGLLFIVLALWCSHRLRLRAPTLVWRHLPGFLWFFLQRLIAGGVDVALRTVSRKLAISPSWVDYELQADSTDLNLCLSAVVGLLPGTLAAKIEGQLMRVHLLDTRPDWHHDIARLESHLTVLFRVREPQR
ncbi:MAG: Na+/H+ antiporter subunit E [Pseudohongiella sp.]|nr:Na+/H+ antiporter subunit E [Pseudohongiella sp.]MDP2126039.1 Na+/H+ antiporter subunit E [Pseudohongiella sp.]